MKLPYSFSHKAPKQELPLVPLGELIVFPHMVVPFLVARQGSIKAVEQAMGNDRKLFLGYVKAEQPELTDVDLHRVGTIVNILQMLKLPDGSLRLLVEGSKRGEVVKYLKKNPPFRVQVKTIEDTPPSGGSAGTSALIRTILESFKLYAELNKKLAPDTVKLVEKTTDPDKLVDLIAGNLPFSSEKKLELLALTSPSERLEHLAILLEAENEVLSLQQNIHSRVRKRMERSQKEYFLNEQLKEINRELGFEEGDDPAGIKDLTERLKARRLPAEVEEKARRELKRLSRLQPISPEAGVLRTYVEWIADLPWDEKSVDNDDIETAARVLDEDHYDMKQPKERVLDFIAVRQLAQKGKGPILCFVGPPGTGKTSLGKSVARALGRSFIRISLGGVRDEAEIRGHRKTYVGALPGKIIQSMKRAGTSNPVFLLDEIDKMSSDFRGDPASALLEVLDPEQNGAFVDHYLEVPYDLSDVMFITTANAGFRIPHALRDRMEIIEIPGYTEFEKLAIAERFLIPKQIRENGLEGAQVSFTSEASLEIIRNYTMESGVRNLERQIAQISRKIAREALKAGYRTSPPPDTAGSSGDVRPDESVEQVEADTGETVHAEASGAVQEAVPAPGPTGSGSHEETELTAVESVPAVARSSGDDDQVPPTEKRIEGYDEVVDMGKVRKHLGPPRFQRELLHTETRPGLAYGLAWTEVGGRILPIEVSVFEGRGDLILTGSLGGVMKESARTSLSFIRAHSHKFNLPPNFAYGRDIHIHVPEGAIPKDGPSAGIALTAAILSALSGVSIRQGFAMTGEITLTGRILAIGGLKEKMLAAHRHKMVSVVIPDENRQDTDDFPEEVLSAVKMNFVHSAMEALEIMFPEDLFRPGKNSYP